MHMFICVEGIGGAGSRLLGKDGLRVVGGLCLQCSGLQGLLCDRTVRTDEVAASRQCFSWDLNRDGSFTYSIS